MKAFFASVISFVGVIAAIGGTQACPVLVWDEPEYPKHLIK